MVTNDGSKMVIIDLGLGFQHGVDDPCLRCGTKAFLPPEANRYVDFHSPYSMDVFSLGIVLLVMRTGEVKPSSLGWVDTFADIRQFGHYNKKNFSAEFMSLVSQMIEFYPQFRITMEEVLAHPFFAASTHPRATSAVLKRKATH